MIHDEDLWTSILTPYKFNPVSARSLARVLYSLGISGFMRF